MLEDFNLIISTPKGNEKDGCSEAWYLLGELGDREAAVDVTPVAGLIVAKTKLNPFEAIEGLRRILAERPEEFRYIMRVIPVEKVVRTSLENISRAAEELASKIGPEEKFRVTVEKRHTDLESRQIIVAAAEKVSRKVDLENPDKILLIEVVGKYTGLSVIRPGDILSVAKERRP